MSYVGSGLGAKLTNRALSPAEVCQEDLHTAIKNTKEWNDYWNARMRGDSKLTDYYYRRFKNSSANKKYHRDLLLCGRRIRNRAGVKFGTQGLGEYFSGIGAAESGGFCAPDNAGMCFETPSARDTAANYVQYGHTPDPAAWANTPCPTKFVITDENVNKFRPSEITRFPVCTNENYAKIVAQTPNFNRSAEEGEDEGGGSSTESEDDKKKKMYLIGGAVVLAVGGLAFFMLRKKKR